MSKLRPVVVCGPSGVGKGTLIARLKRDVPNAFGVAVSHTTRAPRPGEENGVQYHFVQREEFERGIAQNKFIEYADVHGNLYGTSYASVESQLEQGRTCFLEIDVQGAEQLKSSTLDPVFLFIRAPSLEILEHRLRGRNTESEESIGVRMETARAEMQFLEQHDGFFDFVIINDDLEQSYTAFRDGLFRLMPQLKQMQAE
ncbi:MAG: hypothetical protein MHM6MM_000779 [Cercozoa sp. M6MM]